MGYLVPALLCGAGTLIGGFTWAWKRYPSFKGWVTTVVIGVPMYIGWGILYWLYGLLAKK